MIKVNDWLVPLGYTFLPKWNHFLGLLLCILLKVLVLYSPGSDGTLALLCINSNYLSGLNL